MSIRRIEKIQLCRLTVESAGSTFGMIVKPQVGLALWKSQGIPGE
jgi:hypothetical protein